jgi:hypothetical protein
MYDSWQKIGEVTYFLDIFFFHVLCEICYFFFTDWKKYETDMFLWNRSKTAWSTYQGGVAQPSVAALSSGTTTRADLGRRLTADMTHVPPSWFIWRTTKRPREAATIVNQRRPSATGYNHQEVGSKGVWCSSPQAAFLGSDGSTHHRMKRSASRPHLT